MSRENTSPSAGPEVIALASSPLLSARVLRPVTGPVRSRFFIRLQAHPPIHPQNSPAKPFIQNTLPLSPTRSSVCADFSLSSTKQGISGVRGVPIPITNPVLGSWGALCLCLGSGRAPKETFSADVFVDGGPVNAVATARDFQSRRCSGVAWKSLGNQARGTVMVRPSFRRTLSVS